MEIQPSPQTDKNIAPMDENPRPVAIRKLDRVETTQPSSMNGG